MGALIYLGWSPKLTYLQCDQIALLIFQDLPICNNENFIPKALKNFINLPNIMQIVKQLPKTLLTVWRIFAKSGHNAPTSYIQRHDPFEKTFKTKKDFFLLRPFYTIFISDRWHYTGWGAEEAFIPDSSQQGVSSHVVAFNFKKNDSYYFKVVDFCFKIWANPCLFLFIFVFLKTNITILTTNMVPGFELTTFGTIVSSDNH